jgi:2-oxoglutarate ferredoxin oxidoreductase subunit delta
MPPSISEKLCDGCGACVEVCPVAVLAMKDGKAVVVNVEACTECRACETSCPTGAITLE